jgi:HD-like signal output (HDOD) protein
VIGTETSFEYRLERQLASAALKLPVLLSVGARVLQEVDRPGSTAASVGDIVQGDPSLSARVLRMANSAAYGGLSEVRSVPHAISRLGSSMVVAIVLGGASKGLLQCENPDLLELANRTWSRSVHAATFGRLAAPARGVDPGFAFLGGLLHAAGAPLIIQVCERLSEDAEIELPTPLTLDRVIRRAHPEVGGRLLAAWQLPKPLVAAVRHQGCPGEAPAGDRPLADTVAAAAMYAVESEARPRGPAGPFFLGRPEFSWLGGDPARLEELVAQAREHGTELEALFR